MENETDAIIVVSYGTFSTGINIRNIDNIVFASPQKQNQSASVHWKRENTENGDKSKSLKVFDLSDDLTSSSRINFTLRHFQQRLNIYDEQKFDYEIRRINLK